MSLSTVAFGLGFVGDLAMRVFVGVVEVVGSNPAATISFHQAIHQKISHLTIFVAANFPRVSFRYKPGKPVRRGRRRGDGSRSRLSFAST